MASDIKDRFSSSKLEFHVVIRYWIWNGIMAVKESKLIYVYGTAAPQHAPIESNLASLKGEDFPSKMK